MSIATAILPDFDLNAATQNQVVEKIKSVDAELKTINAAANAGTATIPELDRGDALTGLLNELKEKNNGFAARYKKIGDASRDVTDYLTKPAGGMVHVGSDKGGFQSDNKGVAISNWAEARELAEMPKGIPVFKSASGFFHAVRTEHDSDSRDKLNGWDRLVRDFKAASGMSEANEPDGGALIPPEFSQTIYDRSLAEENYLADCDVMTVKGNAVTLPALDDASRKDGSRFGGVTSYWAGEADAFTASRPKFRTMDFKPHKLTVLIYLTSELIEDSPFALGNYVSALAAKEIGFKSNNALINGLGTGMPKGIMASGAKITVTKETNQQANTLLVDNIENMWMRFNPMCRKKGVWLHNNDTEAQLNLMAFPVGTGGVPIFQPQGGVANPSFATLKGRPLIASEYCQTLGTEGDLILVDWSFYQAVTKGGVNAAMSMHVKFLTDELAYRFGFRLDGQTKWEKPLTPFNGTTTTSCVVTLGTRA